MTSNSVDVGEEPDGQLYLVTKDHQNLAIPDPESLISILSGKIQNAARHSHKVDYTRLDDTIVGNFYHTHKNGHVPHDHTHYNTP